MYPVWGCVAVVVWLCGSVVGGCVGALLCCCVAVALWLWLFGCIAVWLCGCVAASHPAGVVPQVTNAHHGDIACVAFSHDLSLVATAGSDTTIKVWDFQYISFEGMCLGHDCEVVALSFVEPYGLLASADAGGRVFLWSVRPQYPAYRCVATFVNATPGVSPSLQDSATALVESITSMATWYVTAPADGHRPVHRWHVHSRGVGTRGVCVVVCVCVAMCGCVAVCGCMCGCMCGCGCGCGCGCVCGCASYQPDAGEEIAEGVRRGRHVVIIGNDQGQLWVWDLTPLLTHLGFEAVKESDMMKSKGTRQAC